jgi:hypothetical protein
MLLWLLGVLDKFDSYDYGLVTRPPSSQYVPHWLYVGGAVFLTRHEAQGICQYVHHVAGVAETFLDAPTATQCGPDGASPDLLVSRGGVWDFLLLRMA